MTIDTCHECGREYQKIAMHWRQSSCAYPDLSDYQHDVVVGLLMGDGSLVRETVSPSVNVIMTTKSYLQHLSTDCFPVCSGGVYLRFTSEEAAAQVRRSGWHDDAKAKDYSDIYQFTTMCHPELERYESWYLTGEKVFPENIELTPTSLKHWYVGDGCLERGKDPKITTCNEFESKEKINSMFYKVGLTGFYWNEADKSIRFREEGTENFFNYVGRDPLPGFEYKWPEQQ